MYRPFTAREPPRWAPFTTLPGLSSRRRLGLAPASCSHGGYGADRTTASCGFASPHVAATRFGVGRARGTSAKRDCPGVVLGGVVRVSPSPAFANVAVAGAPLGWERPTRNRGNRVERRAVATFSLAGPEYPVVLGLGKIVHAIPWTS